MRKKISSFLLNMWKKPLTKIILYLVLLVIIFALSGAFDSKEGFWAFIVAILTKDETISFFAAAIFTIILAILLKIIETRLEESLKIEDNHHKIIAMYNKHKIDKLDLSKNYYDKDGIFMELHHTKVYKRPLKNKIKDVYSAEYASLDKEMSLYNQFGVLLLPSINIYTNVLGTSKFKFVDDSNIKKLPEFIINNATDFMSAHKYSKMANNLTIRLNDLQVNDDVVSLITSRTYYYHMLLTNRCMDFKIPSGMSVRSLYEFNSKITPLNESKLSNQIGINGMIITSDGYLLLEKRDRKKTTWKNKFAQPISLALKASDLKLSSNDVMKDTLEYAEEKMLGVIIKTIKTNFGLTENDYDKLTLSESFLGVARDLLEGGKPNLYFVVTLNKDSKEVADLLKINAGNNDRQTALKTGKLSSQYYLVRYEDVDVDFDYSLRLKQKRIIKVKRIVYPRCSKAAENFDNFKYFISKLFKKEIEYECGEALLVTLSYLELCQDRIKAIKDK